MIDGYRILIAHDAPLFQSFLKRLIQLCYPSATVMCCADGVAALRAYERVGADLLLTDFHMPQMDGPTLIRTLRSQQVTMPMIGLSGEPLSEQDFCEAGADAFLHPPFSVSDFQKLLYTLLSP